MPLSRPLDWETEFYCDVCDQILFNNVKRKYEVFDEIVYCCVANEICIDCLHKSISGGLIKSEDVNDTRKKNSIIEYLNGRTKAEDIDDKDANAEIHFATTHFSTEAST